MFSVYILLQFFSLLTEANNSLYSYERAGHASLDSIRSHIHSYDSLKIDLNSGRFHHFLSNDPEG
mgnify:FL=1